MILHMTVSKEALKEFNNPRRKIEIGESVFYLTNPVMEEICKSQELIDELTQCIKRSMASKEPSIPLYIEGHTYIRPQDYKRFKENYYTGKAEQLKPYISTNEYGRRYNIHNDLIKKYYLRFRKWKGCSFGMPTELEQVEFDCYMEDCVYKMLTNGKKRKAK